MPNQVLCRADPDSRAKRERTGAGIRHNQSDIGNVMSFRPAKVSATVNWIQSEIPKIIHLWWTTDLRRMGFMYCDVGQWRHIRRRILEKGTPKKQVARETGVSRRTINKMLTHEHPPGYGPRPLRYPKLEPYIQTIDRLLHDTISFPPGANLTIRDIVEHLRRDEGFAGSYDSVRNYIRQRARDDESAWDRAYDLIVQLPKPRALDFVRFLSRGNSPAFASARIQSFVREVAHFQHAPNSTQPRTEAPSRYRMDAPDAPEGDE